MEWAALIAIGMCLIMCNVIFEHRKNRKYFKQFCSLKMWSGINE